MKKILVIFTLICFFSCSTDDDTPDNNITYTVTTIGNQIWTNQNASFSKYLNGDEIPQVQNIVEFLEKTNGCWRYPEDLNKKPVTNLGKIYNNFVFTDSRGIPIPDGFRIPNYDDWAELLAFLDGGNFETSTNGTGIYARNNVEKLLSDYDWAWSSSTNLCSNFTNEYNFNISPFAYHRNDTYSSRTCHFYVYPNLNNIVSILCTSNLINVRSKERLSSLRKFIRYIKN